MENLLLTSAGIAGRESWVRIIVNVDVEYLV